MIYNVRALLSLTLVTVPVGLKVHLLTLVGTILHYKQGQFNAGTYVLPLFREY